jgi:hypothetical protein
VLELDELLELLELELDDSDELLELELDELDELELELLELDELELLENVKVVPVNSIRFMNARNSSPSTADSSARPIYVPVPAYPACT